MENPQTNVEINLKHVPNVGVFISFLSFSKKENKRNVWSILEKTDGKSTTFKWIKTGAHSYVIPLAQRQSRFANGSMDFHQLTTLFPHSSCTNTLDYDSFSTRFHVKATGYKCTTEKYINKQVYLTRHFISLLGFFPPIFPFSYFDVEDLCCDKSKGVACTDRRAAVTEPFYIFWQVGKSFKRRNWITKKKK